MDAPTPPPVDYPAALEGGEPAETALLDKLLRVNRFPFPWRREPFWIAFRSAEERSAGVRLLRRVGFFRDEWTTYL
ncbi:MAG: hypothetical protein HY719_03745 [Planctomycetes bacterium]|nr:hypothetical protein [Planctomycetota bacterium]